ncbi:MAG: FKBP-type peptidyl-prolyl cis-trans isomerase [Fibrobacterales bacterium]
MNIVEKNQKVTICYTLKDSDGTIIEEAPESNPLTYMHGYHYIIPGLEEFLEHKEEGSRHEGIKIPSEKAFGAYSDDLLIAVDKSELEHLSPLDVGMEVEMYQEQEPREVVEHESYLSPDMFKTPKTPEDLFNDNDDDDDDSEEGENPEPAFFIIKEILDNEVILDGNHKLAGKDIIFDITVLSIESATFEEIEQEFLDGDPDDDNDILGLL